MLCNADGFGEQGREGKESEGAVPQNAGLVIDLEVMSWKVVEEVTDDKRVMKKIMNPGEAYEKPNDGARVKRNALFTSLGLTSRIEKFARISRM